MEDKFISLKDFTDWLLANYESVTGCKAEMYFEIMEYLATAPSVGGRKFEAEFLRAQGMTYEEIGKKMGVTRQRVHQLLGTDNFFRPATLAKIPYAGLRNWMLENRVNVQELRRRCGNYVTVDGSAKISAKNAERILEITGLGYEECFRRDDQ